MFRWISLAERGRLKRRLELSLAGICELELLKRRHEARVIGALTLHTRAAEPEKPARARDSSPPEAVWMKLLQQQVGELQVDAGDDADARSGSSERTEGSCPLSLFDFTRPVRLSERPESVGDVFVGRELIRSGPCPGLEGIGEEPCVWVRGHEQEDLRQAQRVETYILSLIQRRSPPARPSKPRTSLAPEPRGVARQSSTREPAGVPWADAEQQCSARYPRPVPAGSPQHAYQHTHSPSSDELVNARYIPAQPCRAQAYKAPKPGRSPERKPRAATRKCRFPEDRIPPKKPGRKACRAQSENNLRGASERKYNTAERSVTPKTRRAAGHRRWRSTLELSQDEAEAEQPIRRSRKPRPHLHPPGESQSSLSEAESPASSSLSSDSDESAGLVWPQQLAPPSPPGNSLQPKAFVKIKASHALKKKILRFRSGSLKVMTTV